MARNLNILDLSCELLINIFGYVDATDLYHLSFVCERFHDLVEDEFLWVWCEARSMPNTKQKVAFCERNINKKSRVVLLAGDYRSEQLITKRFFKSVVDLQALSVLALENQYLRGDQVPLTKYPPHLTELSLRNAFVTNFRDFFKNCSSVLKSLRVLCLDRCKWFDSHSLIPISKLPSLEILSLYMCKQLSDQDVGYISLAGLLGFKVLQVLDVRFTGYGDEVLKSFYRKSKLAELYFQGYAKTYQLECAKRRLELLYGAPTVFHNYLDPFLEVDDTMPQLMVEMFGKAFTLTNHDIQKVSDRGVKCYSFIQKNLNDEYNPPKSVLYERPYSTCTCGHHKPHTQKHAKIPYGQPSQAEVLQLEQQISMLTRRQVTPYVFYLEPDRTAEAMEQSLPSEWAWLSNREPVNDMEILTLEHLSPLLLQLIISEREHQHFQTVKNIIEVKLSTNEVSYRQERTPDIELRGGNIRLRGVYMGATPLQVEVVTDHLGNTSTFEQPSTSRALDEPESPPTKKRKLEDDKAEDSKKCQKPESSHTNGAPCCSKSLKVSLLVDQVSPPDTSNGSSVREKKGSNGNCFHDSDDEKKATSTNAVPGPSGGFLGNKSGGTMDGRAVELSEDYFCFKDKTKPMNNVRVGYFSSDDSSDDDSANNVALGNEEEACSNTEMAHADAPRSPRAPQLMHPPLANNRLNWSRVFDQQVRMAGHAIGVELLRPDVEFIGLRRRRCPNYGVLTPLRYISLRGYDRVTDCSLKSLSHLQLDLIDVTYTRVTKAGVDMFLQTNPGCRVVHESACKCGPRLHF